MLYIERRKKYIVFPSWLQPTYKWEDLPEIISNPLKYDEFHRYNCSVKKQREYSHPEEIQPFELLEGPAGGGIILVYRDSLSRWLPYYALTFDKGVDLSTPELMLEGNWHKNNNVSFLEDTFYSGYWLETGKKRRDYEIGACVEHIESMPDSIFWVVGFEPTKTGREIRSLDDVPAWAEHFGLKVERLLELPGAVKDETDWWLKTLERQFAYFTVKGGGNGFGYHFAVMLYIGFHLRAVAGRRMRTMFLLASIEGKPTPYSGLVAYHQKQSAST
jgi:hypothetical protein